MCSRLLGIGPREALERYLARIFWIDSKTFYIEPTGMYVWAPATADMTVVDERMPKSKKEIKKIVYYAVVNAVVGPVYIEYVTGTTGHPQDMMYPPWAPAGFCVYEPYQVRAPCFTAHMNLCMSQ